FKILIKSVPEKGKANKELISILSKHFKVPKSTVSLLSGHTSRNKIINIEKH
ncbi:DUF167 domain-containing protein, partial [bacterium]|nr:DUF167 domain-containing protein [bacterium]